MSIEAAVPAAVVSPLREETVASLEPRPVVMRSKRNQISNGTIVGAAAGGAGALGIAIVSSVVLRIVRRKGKKAHAAVRSNSASPAKIPAKTASKTAAFGSPSSVAVSPVAAIKFDLDLDPKAQLTKGTKDQTSKPLSVSLAPAVGGLHDSATALPPGSMSKHLALLAEAQEDNKRLKRFLESHSSDSNKNHDKISRLEKENQDLRACMQKLESQLQEVISRPPAPPSTPSSGEELAFLKEKLSLSSKLLNIKAAQSVCSDNDAESIGGHSLLDASQRRKVSTLAQLLGWSSSSNGGGLMSLFPKSPAPSCPPSQPSTPRGTRAVDHSVPPAQVIKMLDAAFSGGPQGSRIMF